MVRGVRWGAMSSNQRSTQRGQRHRLPGDYLPTRHVGYQLGERPLCCTTVAPMRSLAASDDNVPHN
jgi:hypothetical protein